MDISTIEVKVLQRVYKSRKQFEKDFRKMVNNCEVFNGVGNGVFLTFVTHVNYLNIN